MTEQVVDKAKAPNCPTCGKFMDEVYIVVVAQLAKGGRTEVGTRGTGWCCADCMTKE